MSDTKINPVALSSAVAVGATGAVAAPKIKPLVKKVADATAPVVDSVSISAKKAVNSTKNGLGKFIAQAGSFFSKIGKSLSNAAKNLKNYISNLFSSIHLPKSFSKSVSKTVAKTSKLVKTPAVIAGAASGALYTGYKLLSSDKNENV